MKFTLTLTMTLATTEMLILTFTLNLTLTLTLTPCNKTGFGKLSRATLDRTGVDHQIAILVGTNHGLSDGVAMHKKGIDYFV